MTNTLQTKGISQRPAVFLKSVPAGIYIDLAVILLCVAVTFGRTLTSYFLADDFGEIRYLNRICTGEPNLLLANFTGNYMQIPGMSVYRPFLLLSLLIDFLVWKTNAAGFYATNLLFYYLCAALLYLIVLKMAASKINVRNRLTALTAAALFALSPLHCESVSWGLGRVDIVSAFFYLLSLLLIFRSTEKKSRTTTGLAIAAFISGLFVKEMAIGIPVMAFLIGWLYIPGSDIRKPVESLSRAFKFSAPYLVATVLYFILRFICLGTLVGGYVAGFGASQERNALTRWLDKDTITRIALPFVEGHFQSVQLLSLALIALYALLFGVFLIRLLARQIPAKVIFFTLGWFVTTLLPIYKLWGIGYNLEGARFLFFFTLPLSTFLAAGLFQNDDSEGKLLDRALITVSSAVAVLLCAIFGYVAAKTDLIWVNAGKETKATAFMARQILDSNAPLPAVFLGIPKESKGTHMILNGDTFKAAVSLPFAAQEPRRKFATFEPVMYSPEHEIDSHRLKSMAHNGLDVFVWNSEKRQFDKVEFKGGLPAFVETQAGDHFKQNWQSGGRQGLVKLSGREISFNENDGSQGILLSQLNMSPLKTDFAVVELKVEDSPARKFIGASWSDTPDNKDFLTKSVIDVRIADGGKGRVQKVFVPLSRNWKWFEKPSIQSIFFSLPAGNSTVYSLRLCSEAECSPLAHVTGVKENENGTGILDAGQQPNIEINAESLKGTSKLLVEITKANYFFDNFKESGGADAVEKTIEIKGNAFCLKLKRKDFAGSGFFQIRVVAQDENGKQIGAPSCCMTFAVN